MPAVTARRYGWPATLEHERLAVPVPASGEVRVRVHGAAIDKGTLLMLEGRPWLARPMFGIRRPRHAVPGLDVAGTVDAVGAGVTGVVVGDRVVGIARGGLAEYAIVPVGKLAPAPTSIDLLHAAALPVSGITALQAVRAAQLRPGCTVVVSGASGGVGHYVVQLACAAGAEVTAVCSAAKAEFARSLGASHVHAYDRDGALADAGRRWDVVIDVMGGTDVRGLVRVTAPGGTIVLVGGDSGGRLTAGYGRQLRALLVRPFVRRRIVVIASAERAGDIVELVGRVDDGAVVPHVDRVVPLAGAGDAIALLASGAVRGKVVVAV